MVSRFECVGTEIPGLKVMTRQPVEDARGFLSRLYCFQEFGRAGMQKPMVQVNHTGTRHAGTVRGLHYQHPPHAETKVVLCLRGEIFDVAVDLRRGSPSFLHWHGEILSAENNKALLIPEGCAHGFQVLGDDCELLYFHTADYRAEAEGGVHAEDPLIGIRWPLPVRGLSERDRGHAWLGAGFHGLSL